MNDQPNQPSDSSQNNPTQAPPAPATPIEQPQVPNRWPVYLIGIIVFALVSVTGWLLWHNRQSKPTVAAKQDIQLVRYGTPEGVLNRFYPAATTDSQDYDINQQIFEGLVQFEDRNKISPLLAESWTNPDATSWVFNLKQGVSFHSGRTMTAKDVKFSLENFRNSDLGQVFDTTIKSVDVVNDYQVKITTDGPDPLLLNRLVFLPIIDSASTVKNDPVNGTGPYTLKPGTTATEKEVDLVAYDKYHGGHVYTREIDYKYYDSTDKMIADRQKGLIDIAADITSQLTADKLKPGSAIGARFAAGTYFVGVNTLQKDSPLAKLKVRQALYLATDVPALLSAAGYSGEPASQIVGDFVPGYNPEIKRPARDVAKAKQLLAEAGYPNGLTLTLTFYAPRKAVGDELKRQFAEAGVTIVEDGISDTSILGGKAFGGKAQLFFASYTSDLLDLSDVVSQVFQGKNYNNPQINDLQSKANATLDQPARLALLQQESKILMDDVAWIPLFSSHTFWAIDPAYVLSTDRPNGTFGVNFWKVYRN